MASADTTPTKEQLKAALQLGLSRARQGTLRGLRVTGFRHISNERWCAGRWRPADTCSAGGSTKSLRAASICPTATGEWWRLAARLAPRSSHRREAISGRLWRRPRTRRRRTATAQFLSHGASLTRPGGLGGVGDGSAGPAPPPG